MWCGKSRMLIVGLGAVLPKEPHTLHWWGEFEKKKNNSLFRRQVQSSLWQGNLRQLQTQAAKTTPRQVLVRIEIGAKAGKEQIKCKETRGGLLKQPPAMCAACAQTWNMVSTVTHVKKPAPVCVGAP